MFVLGRLLVVTVPSEHLLHLVMEALLEMTLQQRMPVQRLPVTIRQLQPMVTRHPLTQKMAAV